MTIWKSSTFRVTTIYSGEKSRQTFRASKSPANSGHHQLHGKEQIVTRFNGRAFRFRICVSNEYWRRERDSNPRSAMRTIAFEATAFNRSAISPAKQCKVQSAGCRVKMSATICSLPPVIFEWRRERDSNPRYAFWAYTRLAGERLQPTRPSLQQNSVKCRV